MRGRMEARREHGDGAAREPANPCTARTKYHYHLPARPSQDVVNTDRTIDLSSHLSPRPTKRFGALNLSFGFERGGTSPRRGTVAVEPDGDEQVFGVVDAAFDRLKQEISQGDRADAAESERGELKLNEIEDSSTTPKPYHSADDDDAFMIKFPARNHPSTLDSLPSLHQFPPKLPSYQDLPPPKPYNPNYPHPIGIYASAHINPAAVRASGFDVLLDQVSKEDPRVLAAAQIDPAILVPLKVLEKEGNENSSPAILALLHDAARRADEYLGGQSYQHLPPRFRPQPLSSPPKLYHSASSISLVSLGSVSEHSVDSAPPPSTPHHVPRRRESMPVFVGGRGLSDSSHPSDHHEPTGSYRHRRVSMPVIKRVGALRLEHSFEDPVQSSPSPEMKVSSLSPETKYKTEACQSFWIHGSCAYGRFCVFLHSDLDPVGGIPGVTRLLEAGLPMVEQERINAEVYEFMHASQVDLTAYSPPLGQVSLPSENVILRRASSDIVLGGIAKQNELRRRQAATRSGPAQLFKNRSSSLSNLAEHTTFDPFAVSPSPTPQPQPTEPCTTDQDAVVFPSSRHTRSSTSVLPTFSGKAGDGSWDYTAPTSIWR